MVKCLVLIMLMQEGELDGINMWRYLNICTKYTQPWPQVMKSNTSNIFAFHYHPEARTLLFTDQYHLPTILRVRPMMISTGQNGLNTLLRDRAMMLTESSKHTSDWVAMDAAPSVFHVFCFYCESVEIYVCWL